MSKVLSKSFTAFAIAVLFAALIAMAGCSSQQAASIDSSASGEEATTQEADVTVGQESNTAKTLVMKNSTGKSITGVALGKAGSAEDSFVTLEVQGGEWPDGKTATIYYEPTNASFFDIQIKCGEDAYTLHEFNFEGVENIEVMMEGDVAYVTFERGGNVVSSLSEEMALHDAEIVVEEVAEAEAEAETYYYEETQTYNAPAAPAAPAQTEDQCVEGGVVLR